MTDNRRPRRRTTARFTPTADAAAQAAAAASVLLRATARRDRSGELLSLVALNQDVRSALVLILAQLVVTRLDVVAQAEGRTVDELLDEFLSGATAGTYGLPASLLPTTNPGPEVDEDLRAVLRAGIAGDATGTVLLLGSLSGRQLAERLVRILGFTTALITTQADLAGRAAGEYFDSVFAPMLSGELQ